MALALVAPAPVPAIVTDVLAHLDRTYGPLQPGLRDAYALGLSRANLSLLAEGAVRAIRQCGRRMPSVEDILAGVRAEASDRARREGERLKVETPSFDQTTRRAAAQGRIDLRVARRAKAILDQVVQRVISLDEQAAAWEALARDFPDQGWEEVAADCRRRLAARAARQDRQEPPLTVAPGAQEATDDAEAGSTP